MKLLLPIALLLLSGISAFSQSKNNISLVYGTASTDVNTHGAVGDYGYSSERGTQYGALYTLQIKKFFSLETGLLYADDRSKLNYIVPGQGEVFQDGSVQLLSVPVYARFNFWKYLFANAGFTVDKQTNHNSNSIMPDQSGIGAETGIGGQYDFGRFRIFFNPFIRYHGLIYFNSNVSNNQLIEQGIRFGAGYNF